MDYIRYQKQVETRLWTAAEGTATRAALRLEPECEARLREEIQRGANWMLGRGLVMDPVAIGRAYGSTITLVEAMVASARERRRLELDEQSLADALARLCPLFPFC